MNYTNLGRTGLKVSKLVLGTGNFGSNASEQDGHAIMDAALDAGINLFDTGDIYGGKENPDSDRPGGLTEAIIGRWLEKDRSRRDKIVLATKVWGVMGLGQNDRGLSALHIRAACDESLRRLKTDRIDLYQMHSVDWSAPAEEIWQAMECLIRQGKVLYVGSSNFPAWYLAHMHATAQRMGLFGLASEQSRYNAADRHAEKELLPAIKFFGIGMLAYSPIAGGLLGGVLDNPKGGQRSGPFVQYDLGKRREAVEKWEALCKKIGGAPGEVALAWVLLNPQVSAPIIGPRTLAQLQSTLKALDVSLGEEERKEIDAIWAPTQ